MDDIYKNIQNHSTNKKCKILIVFADIIVDILSNKRFNSVVTDYLLEVES